jgi:hypothetical protein
LAIAVVNEVKTNISLANLKLKHEDELDKSIGWRREAVKFEIIKKNEGNLQNSI